MVVVLRDSNVEVHVKTHRKVRVVVLMVLVTEDVTISTGVINNEDIDMLSGGIGVVISIDAKVTSSLLLERVIIAVICNVLRMLDEDSEDRGLIMTASLTRAQELKDGKNNLTRN